MGGFHMKLNHDQKKDLKVAVYTRVSTDIQVKKGFSLDAQYEKLKYYCYSKDWKIFKHYVEEGYSGRDTKRSAYQEMMMEIDQWDILLVIKIDRIHRNSKNFIAMMEELKEKNKEFVSMMESLDTSSAMCRFAIDIIQRIAQLESEQIGERVYEVMKHKVRTKGGYLGGNTPFGYSYENKEFIIIEYEDENVRAIFSWYLNEKSMSDIVKILNFAGIPTKKKSYWRIQTISNILKNPLYCGFLRWDSYIYKHDHETIISISDFNKVQKIFDGMIWKNE